MFHDAPSPCFAISLLQLQLEATIAMLQGLSPLMTVSQMMDISASLDEGLSMMGYALVAAGRRPPAGRSESFLSVSFFNLLDCR